TLSRGGGNTERIAPGDLKSDEKKLGQLAVEPADSLCHVEHEEDHQAADQQKQDEAWRRVKQMLEPRHIADLNMRVATDQAHQRTSDKPEAEGDAHHGKNEVSHPQRQHE